MSHFSVGCLLEALHTQPVRTFMTGFVVLIEGQLCAVVSGEQLTKETGSKSSWTE